MTQYARGANFERQVKKGLEAADYFVVRSAGSRSQVDLVSVSPTGELSFIQCKLKGKLSKKDHEALVQLAKEYGAKPVLASKTKGGSTLVELE